eukprot:161704-Chlamydomonas_euryale.AAC.7
MLLKTFQCSTQWEIECRAVLDWKTPFQSSCIVGRPHFKALALFRMKSRVPKCFVVILICMVRYMEAITADAAHPGSLYSTIARKQVGLCQAVDLEYASRLTPA